MTRKESIALIHKEAIAHAAKTLFQMNGVVGTTMDEIAREAAYSKATIYVYFSSKDDLLNYLARQGMTQLLERISRVVESKEDALDQYRAVCSELVAFSDAEPLLFELTTEKIAFGEQAAQDGEAMQDELAGQDDQTMQGEPDARKKKRAARNGQAAQNNQPTNQASDRILDETYQVGERINDCIETALRNGIAQGHFREDIQVLPTEFFLWATLAGLIRMASNKEEYMQHRMGLGKEEFLELSFETLLRALLKNDAAQQARTSSNT